MHVLLTGGTGYVGSAVLRRLVDKGHRVTAIARTSQKAAVIRDAGAEPVLADLADRDALRELAAASEGIVHTGTPGDETSATVDEAAISTFLDALRGTNRPLVQTTGVWVHGSGSALNESSRMNSPRISEWRVPLADAVRRAEGVRGTVIAPGLVHGHGGGLLNVVAAGPQDGSDAASLMMIGSGDQHWSTVHVDDLAELYTLALEKAPAGSYFLGVSGSTTVRDISEAVSRSIGLGGRVRPEPVAESLDRLGLLGEALLLDQRVTSDAARRALGWNPEGPSILADIEQTSFVLP